MTRKQRRNPAKSSPILRSTTRTSVLVTGPGGGQASGGDRGVASGGTDRGDFVDLRDRQPDRRRVMADPGHAGTLGVAAAQDRVLLFERLDVLVDVTGGGGDAEGDDVEGDDAGQEDAEDA